MFSKRLDWTLGRNRIADELAAQSRPYVDLTGSNPTRAGFEWPVDLLASLAHSRALLYDPDPRGLLSARQAVAEYQQVGAEQVLLTASTSEAYSYLFKLLANPGDEILAPRPSYPLFDFLARLESVRIVQYPLFYDHGWSIDLAALEALVTPRTRALVLVNPNNPTGSFLKRAEWEALEALCVRHDLAVISDEVFADFALVEDHDWVRCVARAGGHVPAFSLGGLSKACGLPQLKLGWIVSSSASALDRLELIADTFLSVATPVQVALPRLLDARHAIQRQIIHRLQANLARLASPPDRNETPSEPRPSRSGQTGEEMSSDPLTVRDGSLSPFTEAGATTPRSSSKAAGQPWSACQPSRPTRNGYSTSCATTTSWSSQASSTTFPQGLVTSSSAC